MIKQVCIDLPNEPGSLQKVVKSLVDGRVDMKALELSDRGKGERGVASLIVADAERAAKMLREAGHTCEVVPAVAVEVPDRVGGLLEILGVISGHKLNVRGLYCFVSRVEGKSLCVLTVDDPVRTEAFLIRAGHKVATPHSLDPRPQGDASSLGQHLGSDFIW